MRSFETIRREGIIAAQAQQLAQAQFPGGRVEPEAIAEREGIAYCYDSFPDDFDGVLSYRAGRFFIICNHRRVKRGTPRSRFTFAHELGHYFIPAHREALSSGRVPTYYSFAEYASNRPVERESDLFAANLLMPGGLFCQQAARFPRGLQQVTGLASFFGTSVSATAFRAVDLDLFPAPAAVFRWDAMGRRVGRRMSFETYYADADLRSMAERIPSDSVTARALQTGARGIQKASSSCLTWFNLLDADDPDNLPLTEEVMALGKYGWLTLVYRDQGAGQSFG